MRPFDMIPAAEGADFALRVLDDSLLPYFKAGEAVPLQRRTDLRDGEIGLFRSRNGMVFRQFLQDSQGNVYLLAVNRRYRALDVTVPRKRVHDLICYGRVRTKQRIPLPTD